VEQEFQDGTSRSLRIGELASRAAMTVDPIRFYERRGLLPKAERSTGRFRVCSPHDLESTMSFDGPEQMPVTGEEYRGNQGNSFVPLAQFYRALNFHDLEASILNR
jgi:hypothetical protein